MEVSGLPEGVLARVQVTGPGGYSRTLTAGQTLAVEAGIYTLRAEKTADTHPLIRQAYRGGASPSPTCVRPGETTSVAVAYAPIPTSGRLWLGDDSADRTLGFARGNLAAGGTLNPDPSAPTRGSEGLAFDQEGNLWVLGGTTADPHLYRYPAETLTGPSPTPDRRIDLQGLTCLPSGLAFDPEGNLWVAATCTDRVYRLTREQLAGAGSGRTTLSAGVILQVDNPQHLAFDAGGNLWLGRGGSSDGTTVRYDRARLEASYSGPPDRELIASDGVSRLDAYRLAFDAGGNLWVMAFGDNALYRFTPAELAGTGSTSLTPSVRVYLNVGALLYGMAFDEGGGLWVTYTADRFARLAPGQLSGVNSPGSPVIPERVFTVGTSGTQYTRFPALYPAPAGLPLYHRLP
ncbi:hypothetical protein DV704_11475 [Meiothermus sp. QL-1]|uniref:Vgb family protein n=1 Tax=Meiothermus sp. QL-1 TaxID=2058095 RepID=UPI000E0B3971|nr:hypothetical protein [Meiothermus sp. QL-1]RDI94603.1 hypothetical protein DV704_11475 [Meiothermus sp. QL-1]